MLLYDPIEDTPEYKRIEAEVNEQAEKNIDSNICYGRCDFFWSEKKRLLRDKYGIEWKSPAEMNPGWDFI